MNADLRSDTVTRPTPAMWEAMRQAPLGDDVFGDDPTVIALEHRCAELVDKQSALFVPSGTMANLIAIAAWTRPGDEVLLHEDAHPFHYEGAGAAAFAGVQLRTLRGPRGTLTPQDVRQAIRSDDPHHPRSSLLCVEDTHNRAGGAVQPLEGLDQACFTAHESGLRTHLDGARLWNAVVASGVSAARRARGFDSVSFCFSKGLGCPAGSVLCGPGPMIHQARRLRKRLGGGMRQAGLLAGAALYALQHHVDRLAEDHRRARDTARGLRSLGFEVNEPDTNIVFVDLPDAEAFVERLSALHVQCLATLPGRIRLVFHLDVGDEAAQAAVAAFHQARAAL
jgi:threonine aldolase